MTGIQPVGSTPQGRDTPSLLCGSRHPSPWQDVAHNLSEASLPLTASRRPTTPAPTEFLPGQSQSVVDELSTSQALRDWERLLALPDSDFRRHQLIHPSIPAPVSSAPKLAAERDKHGHIEYKLKLIDPSPERFERLVTQMMWRLKEGRNEAIYELGLADDGTVIGLTRLEMDASLRTLELMASEIGATVMILKEIVLSGSTANPPLLTSAFPSSLSSSTNSLHSSLYSHSDSSWVIQRPDLDDNGKPRKGTHTVNLSGPQSKSRRRGKDFRERDGYVHQGKSQVARPIIFDDFDDGSSDSSQNSPVTGPSRSSMTTSSTNLTGDDGDQDDPPTFHLDLEVDPPLPHSRWRDAPNHIRKLPLPKSAEELAEKERKAAVKMMRSAARREERRLDLLRGDGMTASSGLPEVSANSFDFTVNPDPAHRSSLPNQPPRPSSLRLASPSSSPENSFLDSLLHIPLDSLSLSFADVRTIASDQKTILAQPSSPSTGTECACSPAGPVAASLNSGSIETSHSEPDESIRYRPPPPGDEMICVEALVVRKVQHEEGGEWSDDGEDDVWGFGGDDL